MQVILHTGDMRWNPRMGKHPALAKQRIDQLFLDTTYASPKHTFPSQVCRTCLSPNFACVHAFVYRQAFLRQAPRIDLTQLISHTKDQFLSLSRVAAAAMLSCASYHAPVRHTPGPLMSHAQRDPAFSIQFNAPFVCVQLHCARLSHFHRGQHRQHSQIAFGMPVSSPVLCFCAKSHQRPIVHTDPHHTPALSQHFCCRKG